MSRSVTLRDTKFDAIKAAMALSMVDHETQAHAWMEQRFGKSQAPREIIKSVDETTVSDLDSTATDLQSRELFSAIRKQSVLFRMRGIRRTGFKTRSITTGGSVSSWVEQGQPMPVHKPTISNVGIDRLKLAGMTVVTEEALERAPGFEVSLFSDLTQATVDRLDVTLLNPAAAAVADVSPASLTNGLTAVTATTNPELDIQMLIEDFEGDLSAAYFTMSPRTAAKLAATEIGDDISVRGGELVGVPVLTARAAPTDSIALIDPTGIMAAWDDIAEISVGRGGSVEMVDSSFTQDAPTGAELVSLWQSNLVAFRAVAFVNWQTARPGSVSVLQGGGVSDWLDNLIS